MTGNRYKALLIILLGGTLLSCSLFTGSRNAPEAPPVIRYVNLKFIYDYFINKSRDAQEIARKKEKVIESIQSLERRMKDPKEKTAEVELAHQRQKYLYEVLEKQESEHMQKISQRIKRVLNDLSENMEIDYIFNIGDEVIYAKKKYDITEQVIREVIDLGTRSEPVSR